MRYDVRRQICVEIVQMETALALKVLPHALRWIPWLMSAVLGYFEFDTLGDQQGVLRALWAPLCMLSIPLLAKLWHDRRRGGAACARLATQQRQGGQGKQGAQQGSESHATFGVTADMEFVTINPIVRRKEAVEEAAVESPRGDVSGVESSSIDIVIADRGACSASPADEAPPALSSAVPRPSMLALNSHF